MLRGDVAVSGGITPLIKIAHLAEAFRMKCEVHHGGNSLNNVANLHVILAVNNCDYYEVFPSNGANKFGLVEEWRSTARALFTPLKPLAWLRDRLGPGAPRENPGRSVRPHLPPFVE